MLNTLEVPLLFFGFLEVGLLKNKITITKLSRYKYLKIRDDLAVYRESFPTLYTSLREIIDFLAINYLRCISSQGKK